MLGIKDNKGRWIEWHVNESVPELKGQVITFQADGHELQLIIAALEHGFNYGAFPLVPKCPKCGSEKLGCQNGCTWEI